MTSRYAEMLNDAMVGLDMFFNGQRPPGSKATGWQRVGLVLLTFAYGDKTSGRANYVSNGASRKDIIKFLRETADRFEAGEGTAPAEDVLADGAPVEDKIPGELPPPEPFDPDAELTPLAIDGKLIDYGWRGFQHFVVPANASPGQRADMKACFFAGASTLFQYFASLDEADGEGLEIMSGIDRELQEYAAFVVAQGRPQ